MLVCSPTQSTLVQGASAAEDLSSPMTDFVGLRYGRITPPLTCIVCPVTMLVERDAKNAVALAMSSATPSRPLRYFMPATQRIQRGPRSSARGRSDVSPSQFADPSSAMGGSGSRRCRGSGLVGPCQQRHTCIAGILRRECIVRRCQGFGCRELTGQTTLAVMYGEPSCAMPLVKAISAALAAA